MSSKLSLGLALVAIVIAIFAALHTTGGSKNFGATGTGPGCGGSVTCILGDLYASASITGNTLISLTTALVPGTLYLGGSTTSASIPVNATRQTLATGTTTVCAIQSPAATSTLISASIAESVSSTTASTITVATSSTAFATTTALNSAAVGANLSANFTQISTTSAMSVMAPSTWVVFGQSGGTGTFSPTGTCSAIFAY